MVYTVQWIPCLLSYMIKKTVTSGIHVTLGMSIYSLKMLWRNCTSYSSVWILILHDNQISHLVFLYVPWLNDTYNNSTVTEKTSLVICNNKGPIQPAHPRSLISNFVVCFLRRIIPRLASWEIISTFYLACLVEGTGLSETQKTGFLASWPVLLARQL